MDMTRARACECGLFDSFHFISFRVVVVVVVVVVVLIVIERVKEKGAAVVGRSFVISLLAHRIATRTTVPNVDDASMSNRNGVERGVR